MKPGAHRQAGIIMVIAMIALVVLLLGATALMRSKDTAQLAASNLAFKRDLMNQGERGLVAAQQAVTGGTLTVADVPAANYSASKLDSDIHGIPSVLTADDKTFVKTMTLADMGDNQIAIRYVIDRQCATAGLYDPMTCAPGPPATPQDAGRSAFQQKVARESRPIYRISVRVTGPRQTETYLQMTVAY